MEIIKENLRKLLIEGLNLEDVEPSDIEDDMPLFGEGLELDSLDAVELVVLIQKEYGVEIPDIQEGQKAFSNLNSLAEYIAEKQKK